MKANLARRAFYLLALSLSLALYITMFLSLAAARHPELVSALWAQ